ncbi:MAG TPA: alpha/beta hydrolase [Solirubrobacteraceae bacterium]|nr:alpha/beta hydrolase [Solirubrobacteraceae bacterium]
MEAPLPPLPNVRHREIEVAGVRLHVAEAGDEGAEAVVLQHGWPQHFYAWRAQVEPLSQRYRVICPDLRGFGWSEAPPDGYGKQQLADELVALLDELELERVRYVGHDWGAFVGFLLGLGAPERVSHLFLMSFPHPWPPEGRPDPRRLLRLWYQALIAAPATGGVQPGLVKRVLNAARAVGEFSDEELEIYAARFADPARANAARQLYRTFLLRELRGLVGGEYRSRRLSVRTHLLMGSEDPVLPAEGIGGYEPYTDAMTAEILPGPGHWIAEEAPQEVTDRLLRFLA